MNSNQSIYVGIPTWCESEYELVSNARMGHMKHKWCAVNGTY